MKSIIRSALVAALLLVPTAARAGYATANLVGTLVGSQPIYLGGPYSPPQLAGCALSIDAVGLPQFVLAYYWVGDHSLTVACHLPANVFTVKVKAMFVPAYCLEDQCFHQIALVALHVDVKPGVPR